MTAKVTKVILLSFPGLAFAAFLVVRHVTWKMNGIRSAKVQHQLQESWASNRFISLAKHDDLLNAVQQRCKANGSFLDAPKAALLAEEIVRMCRAYSSGSSEEYAKFRFPSGVSGDVFWNDNWVAFEKGALIAHGITPASCQDRNQQNLEICKQFFDLATDLTNKLGQNLYCTSCWQGIAIESLEIIPFQTQRDTGELQRLLFKEGNINVTHVTLSAFHSVQNILKNQKQLLMATTRFTVQTKGKLGAYPVYIAFLWHPERSGWVPHEMILPFPSDQSEKLLF